MTPEQLEQVVAKTGHARFRDLTSDANAASREHYRRVVERLATGETPSIAEQAVSVVKTVARSAKAGFAMVDDAEYERRMAICRACDQFTAKQRCRLCGCWMKAKNRLATEPCPLGKF